MPKNDSLIGVVVKIKMLQISEFTSATKKVGTAVLKVEFFARNDYNELVKVYQTGSIKRGGGMDVTKRHEKRIRQVIIECLEKFNKSSWNNNIRMPLSPGYYKRSELGAFVESWYL